MLSIGTGGWVAPEYAKDTKALIESGERAGITISPKEADLFRRGFYAGWSGHMIFQDKCAKEKLQELKAKRAEEQQKLRELIPAAENACLERLRAHLSTSGPLTQREEQIFHIAWRRAASLYDPQTASPGLKSSEPPVN
jgi:hypothetical protein